MTSLVCRTGRVIAATLTFATSVALAQIYPSRPIEWVVPYPAGGGTDLVARTLGQAMSETLGQPMVINNKPGAATMIGADYVARAKPDGYTLLSADTATLAANPFLYPKITYNAEKDFAPVGLTVRFPMILVVNPSVPATDLRSFTAWVKSQDGANYATPGSGSPHHLTTELFRGLIGAKMSHVPYRGAAPAVQDVVAGQVPFMFVDTASGQQFIATGKLRPIGVASLKRVKNFENIPTFAQQGLKDFEAYAWQGLTMPAGTPADVVAKVNEALRKALDTTAVKARLHVLGLESMPGTPAQMADFAAKERAKWSQVIRASGIRVE